MRRPVWPVVLTAAALLAGLGLPAQAMPELLLSAGLQWWVWLALLLLAIFLTALAAVLLIPENGSVYGSVAREGGLADPELCAGNCRVLVVDDNLTGQLVLRRLLEQVGYAVDVAGDGREAVNRCRTTDYVAVFMDIRMPVLDGCSATRLIRALPAGESLPVIGVTAGDREARRRCLEAGMNDFMEKPLNKADLQRVLTRWLGRLPAPLPETLPGERAGQPHRAFRERFLSLVARQVTSLTPETVDLVARSVMDEIELHMSRLHESPDAESAGPALDGLERLASELEEIRMADLVTGLRIAWRKQDDDRLPWALHDLERETQRLREALESLVAQTGSADTRQGGSIHTGT